MITMRKTAYLIPLLAASLVLPVGLVYAAVMTSGSYSIQSDSVNFSGNTSTSSSYSLQDTVGEVATGISTSTNYRLSAGYRQMLESYISISVAGSPALPNINGLVGGSGLSSTTWTVLTDNPAGYSLSINAAQSPSLRSAGSSIADYVPAGSAPDFAFTILPTQSMFGFSPQGVNIIQRFKDNGSACNTGSLDTTNSCWDGLSTTPAIIALGSANNQPNGATTTVVYEAKIGSSKIQDSGSYSATITVTAVTL